MTSDWIFFISVFLLIIVLAYVTDFPDDSY